MVKKFLFLILLIVICAAPVLSQDVIYLRTIDVKMECTHEGKDILGNPITPDHLEWRLIRENGQMFDSLSPWVIPKTQVTIQRPRSGTYEAKVRICGTDINGNFGCSEWGSSMNAMQSLLSEDSKSLPPVPPGKNATPGTWKVRFKPSAPTGPIIVY